jgi:hypothetical protein
LGKSLHSQHFWAALTIVVALSRAREGPTVERKNPFLAKCAVAFVEDHADAASTSKAASCRRRILLKRDFFARQRADGGSSARPSRDIIGST